MANQTPALMFLKECTQFINSPETFRAFITQDPTCWQHTIGLLLEKVSCCEKLQNRFEKICNLVQ